MKFEEALKCMREGKRVKRKTHTCCFFMDSDKIFVTYLYKTNKATTEPQEYIWLKEILAEDWKVVNDKIN